MEVDYVFLCTSSQIVADIHRLRENVRIIEFIVPPRRACRSQTTPMLMCAYRVIPGRRSLKIWSSMDQLSGSTANRCSTAEGSVLLQGIDKGGQLRAVTYEYTRNNSQKKKGD